MSSVLNDIIGELTTLATELYEFMLRTEGAPARPGWRRQLESYLRATLRMRLLAGQLDLSGPHDACMLQETLLRDLLERDWSPDRAQWERLERWPLLLLSCLATPLTDQAVDELVTYYRDNGVGGARELMQCFKPGTPAATRPKAPVIALPLANARRAHPAASEKAEARVEPNRDGASVRYVLQHELLDTVNEYFAAANSLHADDVSLARALRLCADRIQLLGISAAGSGMVGLMDSCLLCHEVLAARAERGAGLDLVAAERFKHWSELVGKYLDEPGDAARVDALVRFHRESAFLPALDAREHDGLREFLLHDASAPTPCVVPMPVDAAIAAQANALQPADGDEDEPASESTSAQTTASATHAERESEVPLRDAERELLGLVHAEIAGAMTELNACLAVMRDAARTPDERKGARDAYARELQRFTAAAQAMGLQGLQSLLHFFGANSAHPPTFPDPALCDLLRKWPELVTEYLAAPGDAAVCTRIGAYLKQPAWPLPLAADALDGLLDALRAPVLALDEDAAAQRPTVATAEDVALAVPSDANPKLVDSLLHELPQHASLFTAAIVRIARGDGTLADLEKAQRSAHTLKGAANTVGIAGIANLTHHVEDVLQAYSKQQRIPDGAVARMLQSAADTLEMMSESLLGLAPPPVDARALLQEVLDWANRIDREGLPQSDDVDVPIPPGTETETAPGSSQDAPLRGGLAAADALMLRVPASVIEDLMRFVGESIIVTGQLQEQLRSALQHTRAVADQNAVVQRLADELERVVDARTLAVKPQQAGTFDPLELEQYNELHSMTHRLLEAATDAREMTQGIEDQLGLIRELASSQSRLHKDSQHAVLRARMVPVANLAPRLQRAVRQTCRTLNKNVELMIAGEETLLDRDVLDELADPLMHLLRNAIDHGIEDARRRAQLNKPETGHVELRFARDGDHVVVHCRDDGAGLDLDQIREAALRRNLIEPGKRLSDAELTRLVLLPGFTTRRESTQTSGRGVGLDAVTSHIARLKGSLQISSEGGRGCVVELRIPLTLMSMHALLVRSGGRVMAVSSRGVEQVLYPGSGKIRFNDDRLAYQVDDACYEAYELETLLHAPVDRRWTERADRAGLLVRDATSRLRVVFVEQVVASQELVVKQLGPYLPKIAGIEGATILGTGAVVVVLDLPGLLQAPQKAEVVPLLEALAEAGGAAARPLALVVDDSLSSRRALAEFIADLGFEVRTAIDGREALEEIARRTPDLLLVDMEMPRMNGLELSAQLRGGAVTRDIPIIMITSRSTQKHRHEAMIAGVNVYLTKPFSEEQLLDHVRALTHAARADRPVTTGA